MQTPRIKDLSANSKPCGMVLTSVMCVCGERSFKKGKGKNPFFFDKKESDKWRPSVRQRKGIPLRQQPFDEWSLSIDIDQPSLRERTRKEKNFHKRIPFRL